MSEGESKAANSPQERPNWKKRLIKWSVLLFLILGVSFFTYRWAGTSVYRGTIQRVYEKEAEYRVEFVDADGEVHVAGNKEIRFPYFKLDTADLHAELNRLSGTQDLVEVRVWGFRFSWMSMFPNIIDVEFIRSNTERRREKAEAIADAVIARLSERGILKGGDGVKPELVETIEKALKGSTADSGSSDEPAK